MEETLSLGGNISLTGFRELSNPEMIIIKKIAGNYAKKFGEICRGFGELHLTMKLVHERETSKLHEVHVKCMDNGTPRVAVSTDRNLFVALDSSLKKVLNEINR